MRSSLRAIVLTALIADSPGPAPAHEGGQRVPTAEELRQCPHLARVDWRRVSRDLADAAREGTARRYDVDDEHRRIRGPWPLPDFSRAEIVIDIAIGPGETQEYPTSTSAFVWREPGGQWQVDRVDHAIAATLPPPPPGTPGLSGADLERAKRPVTRGPISAEQAQAIDSVLADPCFAIQPDVTPFHLPLPGGAIDSCYGAISRTIRIRRGTAQRDVTDLCARWPSARLANAVMYANLDLATWIAQTLRARFPTAEIGIAGLREGRRWGMAPTYCAELTVDGRAVPMVFSRWYDHGRYRNDLHVPGEANFDYFWSGRCAVEAAPAPASGSGS